MNSIPQVAVNLEIAKKIEHTERLLWESMWQAVSFKQKESLGLFHKRFAGATAIACKRMPNWLFNRVIGLGLDHPAEQSKIQNIIDWYAKYDLPFAVSLSPFAHPVELADHLQSRGFVNQLDWAKMIRDPAPPPQLSTALKIEAVSEDQHPIALDVICEGFGLPEDLRPLFEVVLRMPNNHCYLAWEKTDAVAFGVLSKIGDVGHLNTACTRPLYRCRGAQSALMGHRIRIGREIGCQSFMTETGIVPKQTNISLQNMIKLGFKMAYSRPNYVFQNDK